MKHLLSALLAVTLLSPSSAFAHEISNAKALELSLHRLERLVILHKIEASYQSQFKSLSLVKKEPTQPTDPTYEVQAFQYSGADGSQKTLTLDLDDDGLEMSHATNTAQDAVNAAVWPTADAVTIAENSLHWLEDQTDAAIKEFGDTATTLILTPATDHTGALIAAVDIQIIPGGQTLRVLMKTDATFISWAILP